jgi:hypothetical protein
MVDLQRPIEASGILFAPGRKTTMEIAISTLRQASVTVETFYAPDSGENFIRWHLKRIGLEPVPSVYVLLEPAFLLEFPDKADRFIGGTRAELRDDIDQRALDIFRHPFGVAADIDVGAIGEPCP